MIYATCCQCIDIWGKRNRFGRLDIAGKNMIYDFYTRCYTRSIRLRCVWGFVFKGFLCGFVGKKNQITGFQNAKNLYIHIGQTIYLLVLDHFRHMYQGYLIYNTVYLQYSTFIFYFLLTSIF